MDYRFAVARVNVIVGWASQPTVTAESLSGYLKCLTATPLALLVGCLLTLQLFSICRIINLFHLSGSLKAFYKE
ncbi:MAG: hypothetical protein J5680_06420 [Neisseriaceae bacterium]|nr:hypothetical protein [Neisseriaceae bacterium]